MPAAAIAAYIAQFVGLLPQMIAAGRDIRAFWKEHRSKVDEMIEQERKPTPEEWAALTKIRDEQHAEIQA